MKITRKKNKDITTLAFDGDLTIYQVTETKDELFADHERLTENIALDLHKVGEIDTAGVQLLLFAKRFFSDVNKNIFIVKSNEIVDSVLHKLDIYSQFTQDAKEASL
ncbi:STAS domain-containing protein [Cellvibrio fontiphilus]|jgi:anti-anti-sigma factor|uniref:Lipid asymmetry maintenance protein MlaB n=1 Tax=Cellvibrio fontiphilus TaxID=1815559 RepID=A0ABV7FII8_9GAMM